MRTLKFRLGAATISIACALGLHAAEPMRADVTDFTRAAIQSTLSTQPNRFLCKSSTPATCEMSTTQKEALLKRLNISAQDLNSIMRGPSPKRCNTAARIATPEMRLAQSPAKKAKVKRTAPAKVTEGKAKITVVNNVDWYDGSGYQFLLDADANTYGTIIDAEGSRLVANDYSAFEYKIPETAAMGQDPDYWLAPYSTASIEIPAGTYDCAMVNPYFDADGNATYYIASGGSANDFKFYAGSEYIFYIEMDYYGDQTLLEVIAPHDLAVQKIEAKGKKPYTDSETLCVTIANTGTENWQGGFSLTLSVDGTTMPTQQVNSITLNTGESTTIELTAKANLAASGPHVVTVSLSSPADCNSTNNVLTQTLHQPTPMPLPVSYDFEEYTDELAALWDIVDANDSEDSKWYFDYTIDEDNIYNGFVSIFADPKRKSDDYLIVVNPAIMEAGKHYMTFDCFGDSYFPGKLELLIGTSSDPSQMRQIWVADPTIDRWQTQVVEFDIEAAGNYYFAFHFYSDPSIFNNYSIDNIYIDKGEFSGNPDAQVSAVIPLPAPARSTAEPIRVEILSKGTEPISALSLSYKVDDGESVTQQFTFDPAIKPYTSAEVEFSQKANLSAVGTYTISLEATDVLSPKGHRETAAGQEDNSSTAEIITMGVFDTPMVADYIVGAAADKWASRGNVCVYDPDKHQLQAHDFENLMSAGVSLTAGKEYRFEIEYLAGELYWGEIIDCAFDVFYGKAGTPIDDWTLLASKQGLYTEYQFVDEEFHFTPGETADYQFAIVPMMCGADVFFHRIAVEEIFDYEARVTNFVAPTILPVKLAEKFAVNTEVLNKGRKDADIQVSVTANGTPVGTHTENSLPNNGRAQSSFDVSIANAQAGQQFSLVAAPTINGAADAVLIAGEPQTLTLHATQMAYDRVPDERLVPECAIGNESALGCGQTFSLSQDAVLTGVTIGWGGASAQDVPFNLYRVDATTGELSLMYETKLNKQFGSGWATYQIEPLQLTTGKYVALVTATGYMVSTDMLYSGSLLVGLPGHELNEQQGLGNAAIRLDFGEGTPTQRDLAVTAITNPSEVGAFSANEPVVATIANRGALHSDGTVTLTINGNKVGDAIAVDLEAYSSTTVTFYADMSAVGDYSIEVSVETDGDEKLENNTLSLNAHCKDGGSPYILNFEECVDFTSEFIPRWTQVSLNEGSNTVINGITFPNGDKLAFEGFFVMNPTMTNPPLDAVTAHRGSRLEWSSCPSSGEDTDHWLISPKLRLPKENAAITLFARNLTNRYGLERFEICVSTTDNDPSNFTVVATDAPMGIDWEELTYSLNDYCGQDVHVAIHHISRDVFALLVDDIEITQPENSVTQVTADPDIALYYDSATETITLTSAGGIKAIDIYSMTGNLVLRKTTSAAPVQYLNVSSLAHGNYVVKITTDNGSTAKRFVKH